jgi:hypothetical protein
MCWPANKPPLNAGRNHELQAIELQGLVVLDLDIEVTGFSLPGLTLCLTRCWRNGPTKAEVEDGVPFRAGGSASAIIAAPIAGVSSSGNALSKVFLSACNLTIVS